MGRASHLCVQPLDNGPTLRRAAREDAVDGALQVGAHIAQPPSRGVASPGRPVVHPVKVDLLLTSSTAALGVSPQHASHKLLIEHPHIQDHNSMHLCSAHLWYAAGLGLVDSIAQVGHHGACPAQRSSTTSSSYTNTVGGRIAGQLIQYGHHLSIHQESLSAGYAHL